MQSREGIIAAAISTMQPSAMGGSYDGKIAGLYDLEETLGSGHFAVVKLARHVFTGAKVAVKVVDKMKLDDVSKAHLFQEVRCMKLVQHPNVVRLYEVIDTQTKLYLILELGDGGDLYDYIMKHEGGLSEDLARKYFRQILRAITYCHQLHVVHRDLKPENVVFFEKLGVVKLTDFGFSNKFSPGQKLETFCGSLAYSAPEILLGDSYDAPAVDIWSLGVILYMLVCGQPPFEKANDSETLTMIMDCKYVVPPQVTRDCRNLIASMLVRDPKKRATLEQIAAHTWLKDSNEYDPSDYLPLVSRQELSEEDHVLILQKMINGNIASKEEILQSLDKNKYNHITATYFLLAEMRLRKYREELVYKQHQQQLLKNNAGVKPGCPQLVCESIVKCTEQPTETDKIELPISINVCVPTSYSLETKTDKRNRKCSIVREEDEDESVCKHDYDANELKVAITHRESISDGRLNRSVNAKSNAVSPIVVPVDVHPKIVVSVDPTLAQKLNIIDRHAMSGPNVLQIGAKDEADNTIKPLTVQDTLRGVRELDMNKIKPLSTGSKNPVVTHRRTKLNKIRTPSCSSSEASDDDTKTRNKKKINKIVGDAPTRFRMQRRDSHDDSSDSQDQAFSSSGAYGHASNIASSSITKADEKKTEHTGGKEQSKPDETPKSSHSYSQKDKKQYKERVFTRHESDKQSVLLGVRRRRIRESQSLDRITEAQEFDLRHRCFAVDNEIEQRNYLFHLNSSSVHEAKECEDDSEIICIKSANMKSSFGVTEAKTRLNKSDIRNLNSTEEINLILDDGSLTKAIHVTRSKCFVTMKKFRSLGKYFPVINFS